MITHTGFVPVCFFVQSGGYMVEFIIGQAGSGKTTAMLERIKQSAEKGCRQCMIVPEQFSYEFDKMLYFYIGADRFNDLFSLSFTSLARQLFQIYGDPGRTGEYADELARMIMVFQAVDSVRKSPEQFAYFRRQCQHSGFAEEVLDLISDMKRAGITPDELMEKGVFMEKQLMDKTRDIAAVYSEYERLMREYGFKDELDNISEAAKTARLYGYFEGQNVYLDEFESFTGDQLEMLRVMIASADNVVLTLRTDDVDADEFTLFETVNMTFRRIAAICRDLHTEYRITDCGNSFRFRSPDLEYLSRRIMRGLPAEPDNSPECRNIRIFEARDMYGETEYVCASIKRLIAGDKELRYRDIAVISNNIEDYAEVLKAAFARYEIPYFMSLERSVAHTPVMVFFSTLLELADSRRFRTEKILRLLKCGILDIDLTDAALLENYCYKWDVDGETWERPFTADDPDLELIEKMRSFIIGKLSAFRKAVAEAADAAEICRLIYGCIDDFDAEKNIAALIERLIIDNKDYEAAEIKRIWGCLVDILDSVHDTLGSKKIPFSELFRILRSMTGKLTYSVPPQTLDSVIAASARNARLNSPKIVFIIGACEGDFPNQVSLHGLFSEADKQKLSLRGIEVSRPVSDLIASERLIVYKALSAASSGLFLTYPLSDLSGQAKYPSQAVDMIMKMFGGNGMLLTENELPPHYYAATMHSAFYHYMQERAGNTVSAASIRKVLLEVPEYRRRLAYVLSRSGHTQDFRVDSEIMKRLKSFEPLRLSSTALEEFSVCRFRYYCDKFLRLAELERVGIDARVTGELSHECFCGILGKRSKQEFIALTYSDIRREIDEAAEHYRSERLAGDFGKDPRFSLMFNKLKESIVEVFLHTQQALMVSDFVPKAYELDIGKNSPVRLGFGGKYTLDFNGIVDRVDLCDIDGRSYIRIVDYKSSRKSIDASTLAGGVNLQMLLYLFALTEKGGMYENCIPAGVLYSPVVIKDVKVENRRIDEFNSAALSSQLRSGGLVLDEQNVLEAMEKDVRGVYIPVKLTKDGIPDKYSSCISASGMKQLREFTYNKLIGMGEALLSGDVSALPLSNGGNNPCAYCGYADICGNADSGMTREPDIEDIGLAEHILGKEKERGDE